MIQYVRATLIDIFIDTIIEVQNILNLILDGIADFGPCYQPCKTMTFVSKYVGVEPFKPKVSAIFVHFEPKVSVAETKFLINEITLMTRIGGIIGVGKEFLWVILLFAGSLRFLFSCFGQTIIFKTRKHRKQIFLT